MGRLLRSFQPRRGGRLPLVLLVAACAIAVTAAVADADSAPPGLRFAQLGHWIANPADDTVFHVNGSAGKVDAQVRIDAIDEGSQVIQSDTSGYVISREKVLEFGKSSLAVEQTMVPPTGEVPFPVEAGGVDYVVYREAGTVVRLGGDDPASIPAGSGLGDPVATPDGTLWLHRTGNNRLCRLAPDTDLVSCPASAPAGHSGALSVVGKQAVFVDTDSDTITPLTGDGLGRSSKIGDDLPADAKIAAADVDGRIAVVDQRSHTLFLVDGSGVGDGRAGRPVKVDLPEGDFAAPVASRSSVVLLDLRDSKVHTYDRQGRPQRVTDVPRETGAEAHLRRGEDRRVYVEGGRGEHVLVVGDDGGAVNVPLVSEPGPRPSGQPVAPPAEQPITPATQQPQQPSPGRQAGDDDNRNTPRQNPTQRSQPRQPTPATPRTNPPRTNPPAPPSRPGMPPRLKASASGTSITVSWGAASPNGASVTGYRVTWTPSGGGTAGSSNRSGGSRSMKISNLERGRTYRITVAAQNSAGRGSAASTSANVPRPAPSITVSRGANTVHEPDCGPPNCAWVKVVMRGFAPNTSYKINIYSDDWDNFNGARLSTDSAGTLIVSDRFAAAPVGQRVWATAGGVESNHYSWPSR